MKTYLVYKPTEASPDADLYKLSQENFFAPLRELSNSLGFTIQEEIPFLGMAMISITKEIGIELQKLGFVLSEVKKNKVRKL